MGPKPKMSLENRRKVLALSEESYSQREIAVRAVGCSQRSVSDILKKQRPTNVKELWTAVNGAWEGFPRKRLVNLIDSMFSRCEAIIEARRGPTNYLIFPHL